MGSLHRKSVRAARQNHLLGYYSATWQFSGIWIKCICRLMDENNIFINSHVAMNLIRFQAKKKETITNDWLNWNQGKHISSYWFSVSYIADGHGLFTWMDGHINYCRDGARKRESTPNSADWTSISHSSLMSAAWSSWEGLCYWKCPDLLGTDSWLIYLSCRQGGVWYTDLCKRSKGVSYVSEWRYCWEWFRSDSALPHFPLSVLHPVSFPLNLRSTHNCCNWSFAMGR